MKKVFLFLIIIYLIPALAWISFAGGHNLSDLKSYSGSKEYSNSISDVLDARFNDSHITLCVRGKLSDSNRYQSEETEFSVEIPLVEGRYSNQISIVPGSNLILVGEQHIQLGCFKGLAEDKIMLSRLDVLPKEVLSPWGISKIKSKVRQTELKYELTIIPRAKSYPHKQFTDEVQVILNTTEEVFGDDRYYEIKLKNTMIYRDITLFEYTKAIVRDVFEFPFQVFVTLFNHG